MNCIVQINSHFSNKSFRLMTSYTHTYTHTYIYIYTLHLLLYIVYKCALQKEILLQGHIYITEHHLCFNANIFGWVTNVC